MEEPEPASSVSQIDPVSHRKSQKSEVTPKGTPIQSDAVKKPASPMFQRIEEADEAEEEQKDSLVPLNQVKQKLVH